MALTLSCAFATSLATPDHVRIAEDLGYRRAWLYDSPALYPDVWVQLCRAAERTERIGLGPGVLIPSLRHPLVTASAIATLVDVAGPDRVAVAVGSGFTGRMAMGQRALPWARVENYVRVVQALLAGEQADWDDAPIRMLHTPGFSPPLPLRVPVIIGAGGPKGIGVAHRVGDGVFGAPGPIPGFDWSVTLAFGTVLAEGEDPGCERVLAAAGPAGSVVLHWAAEHGQIELVPGADRWLASYDDVPAEARHLAMHAGHLVELNEHDRPFVTGDLLAATGAAIPAAAWQEKLAALEAKGATEVSDQPAGPDIPRELEAFADLVNG